MRTNEVLIPGTAVALVVDADAAAMTDLERHLAARGFMSCTADRAAVALALVRMCRFALALVDVVLDDMPGHELIARLHALDPALPVIATARDAGGDAEVRARSAGIVYYAPKPLHLAGLDAVIDHALATPRPGAHGLHHARSHGHGR